MSSPDRFVSRSPEKSLGQSAPDGSGSRTHPGTTRLALCGTFEVASYGDRLFPEIFRRAMRPRMPHLQVRLYSTTSGWDTCDGSRVAPFAELAQPGQALAGFVSGGGDIIRFDRPGVLGDPFPWTSPFTPLFVMPALASAAAGVPFVWNAPALPSPLTGLQAEIVRTVCELADYLSVRDASSQARLAEIGCSAALVPDTGFLLAEALPRAEVETRLPDLLRRFALPGKYAAAHVSPAGSDPADEASAAMALARVAEQLAVKIVLLPLSPLHGDIDACARVAAHHPLRLLACNVDLPPLDAAALIAGACAFLGTGFHGNLTAFAYGVPSVAVNMRRLEKLRCFAELTGRTAAGSWAEAADCLLSGWQGGKTHDDEADRRKKLASDVRRHFRNMADALTSPRRAPTALSWQVLRALTCLMEQQALDAREDLAARDRTIRLLETTVGQPTA